MKIGLHDSEFERMPRKAFPNFVLMKLSTYHKSKGDDVEWWETGKQFDCVYSSKVFDFTPENPHLPIDAIKGGTGYGLYGELPPEIDRQFPDYSLYPKCDHAIGFLTRGCPNNCSWCVVPKKEGKIRPYSEWQAIVRKDTDKLVLTDNNILASEHGIKQLEQLTQTDFHIDLNQGMDIRLLDDAICKILKELKWIKYIRFSCDTQAQIPHFEKLSKLFVKHGISRSKVFIYTLIRKDLDEANDRIQALRGIFKSFNIYAQAERNSLLGIEPSKAQLEFAQRYVYGRSYKKESWNEYCERNNFDNSEDL